MSKNIFIMLLILLTTISNSYSDELVRFNEYNMQPEVWHFVGPVQSDVDAKGDLHLNIPILNIQGTNGFDFPVNFSYKAGITYHQQASWIGLGWNFDPGSITRDVHGKVEFGGVNYDVDYGDDPTSFTYAPDAFYLTIPGKGTFTMGRSNLADFNNYNKDDFLAPFQGQYGFYLQEYQPYKIEGVMDQGFNWDINFTDYQGTVHNDFNRFMVTTDDGIRYIYALPSTARVSDSDNILRNYVNVWRLVGIAGPEFAGNINDLIQTKEAQIGPQNAYDKLADYKDWIKIEYAFNTSLVFNSTVAGERKIQNTYTKWIITPTNYAEFMSKTDRNDIDLVGYPVNSSNSEDISFVYKRLDQIKLYTRAGSVIKKVKLSQSYDLAKSKYTNSTKNQGKLTLNKINFFSYNDQELPGYSLEYGDNPYWSPDIDEHYYDGLGYYNDQPELMMGIDSNITDAQAWSLKKINYPTGGWEEYTYENDHIDNGDMEYLWYRNFNGEAYGKEWLTFSFDSSIALRPCRWQGGIRVKQINREDGSQNGSTIVLSYGNGYVPCIPSRLLPYTDTIENYVTENNFKAVNRGNMDVVYEWVEKRYYPEDNKATAEKLYYEIGQPVYQYSFNNGGKKNMSLYQTEGGTIWTYITDDNDLVFGVPWTTLRKKEVTKGYDKELIEYDSFQSTNRTAANVFPPDDSFYPAYVRLQIAPRNTTEIIKNDRGEYSPFQRREIQKTYSDTTKQLKTITTETNSEKIKKEYIYAHEINEYGGTTWKRELDQLNGMRKDNLLTPMAKNTTYYINKISQHEYYIWVPDTVKVSAYGKYNYPPATNEATFTVDSIQTVSWTCTLKIQKDFENDNRDDFAHFYIYEDDEIIEHKILSVAPDSEVTYSGEFTAFKRKIYKLKAYSASGGAYVTSVGNAIYFKKGVRNSENMGITESQINTYSNDAKWQRFGENETVWHRHKTYHLKSDTVLYTLPEFENWLDTGSYDTAKWILGSTIDEYRYGQIHKVRDANNNLLTLYYGDNVDNFENSESTNSLSRAYLTAIESENGLTKQFDYDSHFMKVDSITDENGNILSYSFDDFGRLFANINSNNDTLNTYNYVYSKSINNDVFLPESPNYIKTKTFFSNTDFNLTYGYSDGLGRQIQSYTSDGYSNLYSAIQLDGAGRKSKEYKTYKKSSESGSGYDPNYATNSEGFSYYSYTSFLDKKLNKIEFPGEQSDKNTNKFYYSYVYAADVIPEFYDTKDSVVFYKTTKIDENGNETYEYTDYFGRTVLTRKPIKSRGRVLPDSSVASIKKSSGHVESVEEFTVDSLQTVTWKLWVAPGSADYKGQIIEDNFVIRTLVAPDSSGTYYGDSFTAKPNRVYQVKVIGNALSSTLIEAIGTANYKSHKKSYLNTYFEYNGSGNLMAVYPPSYFEVENRDDYVTSYDYNTLGQMISKTTPENGITKYKYDANGNLRFVQDANHQANGDDIVFYQYDALNRKTVVGEASNDNLIPEWDELDPDKVYDSGLENFENFTSHPAHLKVEYSYDDEENAYANARNLKGKVTRIKCRAGSGWNYNYYSYNNEGLVEWMVLQQNGMEKRIEYDYDLQGNMINLRFQPDSSDQFCQHFEYNGFGQLHKVYASATNQNPTDASELVAVYSYTPGGQVEKLELGVGAQAVHYDYNIRDWLTGINITGDNTGFASDRFQIKLRYDDVSSGIAGAIDVLPDYTGNITSSEWKVSGSNVVDNQWQGYVYHYDELYRLIGADYSNGNWSLTEDKYDVPEITYDPMGNILSLTRKGYNPDINTVTTMDSLNYSYNKNRLTQVTDNSSNTTFSDIDAESSSYTYDANGNIKSDEVKGIRNINYDYRNLPTKIFYETVKQPAVEADIVEAEVNTVDRDTVHFVVESNQEVDWNCNIDYEQDGFGHFKIYETGNSNNPVVEKTAEGIWNGSFQADSGITYIMEAYVEVETDDGLASIDGNCTTGENGKAIYFTYDPEGNRVNKRTYEGTQQLYFRDASGRTIAVYNQDGKVLFYNIYGLDLIGIKAVTEEGVTVEPAEDPFPDQGDPNPNPGDTYPFQPPWWWQNPPID